MLFMRGPAEFLASLIAWFDSKEKATFIVFVMFALLVVVAGWLGFKHRLFVGRIKNATTVVRTAASDGELDIVDRLNVVGKSLDSNPAVRGVWGHYRAALREDPRRNGSFVNLVDPHAWFVSERLHGNGYEKWASTWAGIFLTLGLLFTFIGLSAALFKVGNAGEDAVHLREAINGILSVSSAKFITSIAGIVFFIFWTLLARTFVAGQQAAANRLALSIQSLTIMVTPEIILMDQLVASQDQTERMKTLADDVAVAFEAKLNTVVGARLDAFPGHVEASLKPVVSAIEGMGKTIGEGNQEAMALVAKQLMTDVNEAAGAEMRSVVEALKTTASELMKAQGGIGNSGSQFGASIVAAADTMTASVTRMAETIERRLGDLDSRIAGVDAALKNGAQSITGMSQGMSAAASAALEESLRIISGQAARAAEQAREQSQAHLLPLMEALRDLVSQIRQTADEGRGHLVDGGKTAADALALAGRMMGDRLTQASDEASTSLAHAATSMAERMDAAVIQFQSLERAVAGHIVHMQQTGETMTAAGTTFGVASERLRQAAEPVTTTLVTIEASAREAAESLRQATAAKGALESAASSLIDAATQANAAFQSYQDRFASTDEVLGRTFERLVGGVTDLSGEVAKVVADMQGHLANAVGALGGGVEQVREMIDSMTATVSDLNDVLSRAPEKMRES
jgi:hypothetical protein